MKTIINNTLSIGGFAMIVFLPYSLYSGSFLHFVLGCLGFVLMMKGLFNEMDSVNNTK